MAWMAVAVAVAGSDRKLCEDNAFAAADGRLVVVADGLGSTGFGAQASETAVVVVAALQDRILAGEPLGQLELGLQQAYAEATGGDRRLATTCLLAAISDQRLVVGGVGDGLALVLRTGGEVEVLAGGRGVFANETEALPNARPRLKAFQPRSVCGVMLATDGVADDLLPGHEHRLASGWADFLRSRGQPDAEQALRVWLTDWKTPGSHDDRSVGLLVWKEEE